MVKNLPANAGYVGWKDPLEKEMPTHSSILAWRIPCTEEPGGPQYTGSEESDITQWLNHRISTKSYPETQNMYSCSCRPPSLCKTEDDSLILSMFLQLDYSSLKTVFCDFLIKSATKTLTKRVLHSASSPPFSSTSPYLLKTFQRLTAVQNKQFHSLSAEP